MQILLITPIHLFYDLTAKKLVCFRFKAQKYIQLTEKILRSSKFLHKGNWQYDTQIRQILLPSFFLN